VAGTPRPEWEPANDVERTLRYAWDRDDPELFVRTLAGAPLYLPGFAGGGRGGTGQPQRLLTRRRGQRTYLLVFTSPEALYAGVGEVVEGWRPTSLTELVQAWPDPDWGLAISPTTPIGAYLDQEQVAAIAEALADEPAFQPADDAEAAMFHAQRGSDPGSYLDVLVTSRVLLRLAEPAGAEDLGQPGFPWRVEPLDGEPTVSAYTSARRLAEAVPEPVPAVSVEVLALARAWPDPAWRLAVNPGSAIAAVFTAAQVAELVSWSRLMAARSGAADPAVPTPAPAPQMAVEVVVDAAEADRYLSAGHDRVTGLVHRAGTAPADAGGYLVRWYPVGPVPDAGQSVRDVTMPSGARLYRLAGGAAHHVATYDDQLRRWVPAVADLLRG
jgi:hypothetical protein